MKTVNSKENRRKAMIIASAAAAYLIGQSAQAGTTGAAVTLSLSGSTAMRNFITLDGFSLVNPSSVVNIGGVNYPANATDWAGNGGSLLSYQLAPLSATGAVSTGTDQAANALRIEWHEQGSVEGILEMVNDQIAPIASITATDRNPTNVNPIWVNRNRFDGTAGKAAGSTINGFQLGAVNTVGGGNTGVAQFNLNGTTTTNSQNAVQMAISDVNARQGFSIAGTAAYNKTPGLAGYGKGNVALAIGSTTQGLGQGGVRHELADATLLNMPAATINPRTGAAFGAGAWNTAGIDNLDNKTIAITATLFVANPGTGLEKLNRTDAQFLQAAGRLPNGADFNVATRDVNSGTLNVAALNVGLDPSFAVGENDSGNGNAADGLTAQTTIGSGIKFSNKTSGGSALRPTVQNARMSLGHLSMSDAIGSTKQGTSRPLRALDYRDDDNDVADNSNNVYRPGVATGDQRDSYTDPASGAFVRASAASIVNGTYAIYQNETFVTAKKPGAAFAGDSAAQWAARTDSATGIQGDNANADTDHFRQNILGSVATFPHPATAASPADLLVDKSFILPQFMAISKTGDGINQSRTNAIYNPTDSNTFLTSPSLTINFNPADPTTVTKGSSSTYGNVTPAGTGAIAITNQNYLFGNFAQNGIRDFAAIKIAQDAQAKLAASGAGVDMFSGSANNTVVTGTTGALASMTNQAGGTGATKGDLIVLGDFNADGKFDGKDLAAMARGAALADNAATDKINLGGGETFGAAIRRGVLVKNAALDYMQANATSQQKIDARNSASDDPTGALAFDKKDVDLNGKMDRNDAAIVDKFNGRNYTNLGHQIGAVINDPFSVNNQTASSGTQVSYNLVNANLTDGKTVIDRTDFDIVRAALGTKLIDGDANFDGLVNGTDFDVWFTHIGALASKQWSLGDFNGDGQVNGVDFDAWFTHIGVAPSGGAPLAGSEVAAIQAYALDVITGAGTVPEPASLGLLGISAAALLGRRKRRHR